jgi:hypothetical protein
VEGSDDLGVRVVGDAGPHLHRFKLLRIGVVLPQDRDIRAAGATLGLPARASAAGLLSASRRTLPRLAALGARAARARCVLRLCGLAALRRSGWLAALALAGLRSAVLAAAAASRNAGFLEQRTLVRRR